MRPPYRLHHLLLFALTLFLTWIFHRVLGWSPLLAGALCLAWPMRARPEGRAVLGLLLLFLAAWILLQLKWVVYPLVGGLLLATWLEPWVSRLARRMPRGAAAACALLPLGLVLLLVVLVLVPTVANQVQTLVSKLPDALRTLRTWSDPWLVRFASGDGTSGLPSILSQGPEEILSRIEKLLHPALEGAAGIGKGLGRAAQLLGALFLMPIFAQYFLVDWPRLLRATEELIPPRWAPPLRTLSAVSARVLRTYLRGQLLVAAIEAVLYAIGFAIGGVSEAIALGILAGFFSLVPVLGFWITALVAVLSALISSAPAHALVAVAVVLGAVQLIENQLLVPKVQGTGLGLHPLAVLLGVLGLGVLFGVAGALFAVPVIGILAALWPEFRRAYLESSFYRGQR
ncbi:MAG: AI-2E family transporter [Candidatus Eisenbacteria bacterium]